MVLKEYFDLLNLGGKTLTFEDMQALKTELLEAGEFGLARLVSDLTHPNELLEYLGEEDEA